MSHKYRINARVDENQAEIVKALRQFGYSVKTGVDDISVGFFDKASGRRINHWYEIKRPEEVGKDGKVRESSKKPSQKKLEREWRGHYRIVTSLDEILADIKADI